MENIFKLNNRDSIIQTAVNKIQLRAEKQADDQFLTDLYVNFGLLERLQPYKNEIITGRRGTGKTHLLLAFCDREFLAENRNIGTIYIDCNRLEGRQVNPEEDLQAKSKKIWLDFLCFLV